MNMLPLVRDRWADLVDAYGSAAGIPDLLLQFEICTPPAKQAIWGKIWSSLAHQSDVYSASFAAVPHIVRFISTHQKDINADYFGFPAWVEICRRKKNIHVPEELASAYFESLAMLPQLVCATTTRDWSASFLQSALCALAVGKGFPYVGEAVQELDSGTARDFLSWLENRQEIG